MAVETNFKQIPIAKKYEIHTITGVIRNIETKMAQSLKKGTNKYYLLNNNNERKLFSLGELMESLPKDEKKPLTEKVKTIQGSPVLPKEKKQKVVKESKKQPCKEVNKTEVEQITSLNVSNYVKSYKLHLLGYSNKQIAEFTNVKPGSVSRDIWLVNEGHRPKPE